MNVVIISGRLTKKPELRTTQSLKHVCQFSIAVNRNYSDEVDFVECVCFDKMAENLVKYQDKGNMIEIEGNIRINTYIDNTNKKRSKTLIYVEMINYISQAKNNTRTSENNGKNVSQQMTNRIDQDNLPF